MPAAAFGGGVHHWSQAAPELQVKLHKFCDFCNDFCKKTVNFNRDFLKVKEEKDI
jgi:hypothetical protein